MDYKIVRTTCKTNKQWRQERAQSIGASAVGILFGEHKYCTPIELRDRMREELAGKFDFSEPLVLLRGHAYEAGVAYLFEHMADKKVIQASSSEYIVRRTDIPFMHASPDRTYWIDPAGPKSGKHANANKGVLECKVVHRPIDPENLPISWQLQIQVQMGICGYSEGYIAWDNQVIADGFGFQRFEFDQSVFGAAVAVCKDFWDRCIVCNETPKPVCMSDVVRVYPDTVDGKVITADKNILELVGIVKDLQVQKKTIEDSIKESKDTLASFFTDEEAIVDPDTRKPIVTYKSKSGSVKVDTALLKEKYPDVYNDVTVQAPGTRSMLFK